MAVDEDSLRLRTWFEALLGVPATDGNRIDVLQNGEQIFPAMLAAIGRAESTIDFATFNLGGSIGVEFADALAAQAQHACGSGCSWTILEPPGSPKTPFRGSTRPAGGWLGSAGCPTLGCGRRRTGATERCWCATAGSPSAAVWGWMTADGETPPTPRSGATPISGFAAQPSTPFMPRS